MNDENDDLSLASLTTMTAKQWEGSWIGSVFYGRANPAAVTPPLRRRGAVNADTSGWWKALRCMLEAREPDELRRIIRNMQRHDQNSVNYTPSPENDVGFKELESMMTLLKVSTTVLCLLVICGLLLISQLSCSFEASSSTLARHLVGGCIADNSLKAVTTPLAALGVLLAREAGAVWGHRYPVLLWGCSALCCWNLCCAGIGDGCIIFMLSAATIVCVAVLLEVGDY